MDIILHIGAHRTGTTSFQDYLNDRSGDLKAAGTVVWSPKRTRKQMFSGLFPGPTIAKGRDLRQRAEGRVQMQVERVRQSGAARLLVSEENTIGSSRLCLRKCMLYPGIGERMARMNAAFGGKISRVLLNIRAQDLWWASVMAYSVGRGHLVPDAQARDKIAHSPRTWRDVITDLACAVPQAELVIAPFEQFAGRPDYLATAATGQAMSRDHADRWLNRAPDYGSLRALVAERGEDPMLLSSQPAEDQTRWQPFTMQQDAALREAYSDDLFWLLAGADGLAKLTEDSTRTRAGTSQPSRVLKKGHDHDLQERYLA